MVRNPLKTLQMINSMLFKDRKHAGEELSSRLQDMRGTDAVVLAIPRGGLPLGAILSKRLGLPLDVVLTKKIGHPYNREYAIGAVSLKGRILETQASEADEGYIESETSRIRALLKTRDEQYHQKREALQVQGKKVILVDDGIATGSTVLATVDLLHQEGAEEIILAIPVAPPSSVRRLAAAAHVDRVVCLYEPRDFYAIGQFYENFGQVSDEEAIALLEGASVES